MDFGILRKGVSFSFKLENMLILKAIIIYETEIELSSHADEGILFITDVQSLQIIFFMCNRFRECSSWKNLRYAGLAKQKAEETNQLTVIGSTSVMTKLKYQASIIVTTQTFKK